MQTLKITDPNFRMNSPEMRRARSNSWFARTEWGIAVLSYADNAALMKDRRLNQGSTRWPEHHGVSSGPYTEWWSKNLLVLEGDAHDRIRRLVNPAFATRAIQPFYSRFSALADSLINEWIDEGAVDFASEFASPYSSRVLCMILGIPECEWQTVLSMASIIGQGIGVNIRDKIADIDRATVEMTQYAEHLIDLRRASPGDDVLTRLVQTADSNSARLSDEELVNLIVLLIFAGIDTTRNQLVLALDSFAKQGDQWELLASSPDRYGAAATEEALRLNPVARWVTREAACSFSYKGIGIEEGTTVHLFTLSAGTDPEEYLLPEKIDLTAERSPHFAFGGGVHHCLGHFVARSDLQFALTALARRIRDIHVSDGVDWLPDSGNTGADSLPITFKKR